MISCCLLTAIDKEPMSNAIVFYFRQRAGTFQQILFAIHPCMAIKSTPKCTTDINILATCGYRNHRRTCE